ncbi:MAG TPA: hypothetical protein DCR93_13035 [Cytophagales bacterium]|nr:hypothetical protein [Cytophagales bacterium]
MRLISNLVAILIFLLGVITFLLEEPLFAGGIILLGTPLFTPTAKLWVKALPQRKGLRLIVFAFLGLALLVSVSSFGRKTYWEEEPRERAVIDALSQHPIHSAQLTNGLTYWFIEKGEGPAVILLHGFPDLASTWDETIAELSKTHRVIAPFLRGYYPTSIPENDDYYVKSVAEDIVALAQVLGVQEYSLIGQDWGASVAYCAANLAPEQVQKVVAVAIPHPSCLMPTPELLFAGRHFFILGSGEYGVRYARKSGFEYIERLYQRWSPDYVDFTESSEPIIETFKYPLRLSAALGYYRSFASETEENSAFYNRIPQIPIYFMAGEHDDIAQPEIVKLMEEKMPEGSKTQVFENSGHFLHHEIFPEFIREVKEFID